MGRFRRGKWWDLEIRLDREIIYHGVNKWKRCDLNPGLSDNKACLLRASLPSEIPIPFLAPQKHVSMRKLPVSFVNDFSSCCRLLSSPFSYQLSLSCALPPDLILPSPLCPSPAGIPYWRAVAS